MRKTPADENSSASVRISYEIRLYQVTGGA
jgi:hypothetical protein